MHRVGYLYEDYHDAWSLEHKVNQYYVQSQDTKSSDIPERYETSSRSFKEVTSVPVV